MYKVTSEGRYRLEIRIVIVIVYNGVKFNIQCSETENK